MWRSSSTVSLSMAEEAPKPSSEGRNEGRYCCRPPVRRTYGVKGFEVWTVWISVGKAGTRAGTAAVPRWGRPGGCKRGEDSISFHTLVHFFWRQRSMAW